MTNHGYNEHFLMALQAFVITDFNCIRQNTVKPCFIELRRTVHFNSMHPWTFMLCLPPLIRAVVLNLFWLAAHFSSEILHTKN